MKKNRLSQETSPYLQQHASNPVDWHPWGEEALRLAQSENKPILLSIGYAACHWCHVMAHESFEDEETARIMNELFVNIKVDREERPDLDKIYQTAHYLLAQRAGGWPLTIFLSPNDLTPFFTGTYFPREPRQSLPPFKEVLRAISAAYKDQADQIVLQNEELRRLLEPPVHSTDSVTLSLQPLPAAMVYLDELYDKTNGGFGKAPKFPQPSMLELLVHNKSVLGALTLKNMAERGLYDQLRGGFYRYSVDAAWRIPHFEKMLTDNGQLLYLYALASRQFNNTFFAEIARETAEWVLAEMQSPDGGYYSSLDADSEGHEGKFYVWDKSEIEALLSPEEYAEAVTYFGLDQPANFENQWHLQAQNALNASKKSVIKNKLLAARNQRTRPARDEKILTSWNALMIKGMLTAGFILNEPRYIASAKQALNFICQHLWKNQRLLATYKDGKAHLNAYLDDYAYLIDALLTYLQLEWNSDYLHFATQLADHLVDRFEDKKSGAFYFTANDHEKLLYRPKTLMDEANPSGNGVAVRVLISLGYLLANTRYLEAAEKALTAAWVPIEKFPGEHCTLLLGLKNLLKPNKIIVLRGEDKAMREWWGYSKIFDSEVYAIPNNAQGLPEALAVHKPQDGVVAYICQGARCLNAIDDFEEFKQVVEK